MAVYPGGAYFQLAGKSRLPLDPRIVTGHTMVGTLAGTEAWFRTRALVSHFGVGPAGEVRQWQDTRWWAASDYQGNPYCISIEHADRGHGFPIWSGSSVPPLTTQQLEADVLLLGWICRTHRIPVRAVASSSRSEHGIGWHRLGIDPWRRPGTPRWSSSYGKICPSDIRIAQLRALIPRVAALTPPPEAGGFLMALTSKQQAEAYQWLREIRLGRPLKTVLRPQLNRIEDATSKRWSESILAQLNLMIQNGFRLAIKPDGHAHAEFVQAVEAAVNRALDQRLGPPQENSS